MNVGILELLAYSLAHDAAHGALVPGRRLNALIDVLAFDLQGVKPPSGSCVTSARTTSSPTAR